MYCIAAEIKFMTIHVYVCFLFEIFMIHNLGMSKKYGLRKQLTEI